MLKAVVIELNLLLVILALTGGFLVLEKAVEKQAETVMEKTVGEGNAAD